MDDLRRGSTVHALYGHHVTNEFGDRSQQRHNTQYQGYVNVIIRSTKLMLNGCRQESAHHGDNTLI